MQFHRIFSRLSFFSVYGNHFVNVNCCKFSSDIMDKPNSQVKIVTHSQSAEAEATKSNGKTSIAVLQMNSKDLKENNLTTITTLLSLASQNGAKMAFLPEACDYIAPSKEKSMEMAETLDGPFVQECKKAAKKFDLWLSMGGIHIKRKGPADGEKKFHNPHLVIDNGGDIRAIYNKTHLFELDIPNKVQMKESDSVIPGDQIHHPICCPPGRLGLATCYDLRFPEMSLALANAGADIIAYPSAFTQVTGMAHWEPLLRARAIETQCYVVAAAQTGAHNERRTSYGHAMVVDPWGAVIAQCSEGVGIALAEIDLQYLNKVRRDMPVSLHRRTDLYGALSIPQFIGNDINDRSSYQFGHVMMQSDQVFYRTYLSYAAVNIKPVLPGHTMVIPLRCVSHFSDLTPAEVTDLFTTVQKVSEVVKRHFGATSQTIAIQDGPEAGQTIKHVHVHILPRKKGDFTDNDEVYDQLQNHDRGWDENTKLRTFEEMATEASQLRSYFTSSS